MFAIDLAVQPRLIVRVHLEKNQLGSHLRLHQTTKAQRLSLTPVPHGHGVSLLTSHLLREVLYEHKERPLEEAALGTGAGMGI